MKRRGETKTTSPWKLDTKLYISNKIAIRKICSNKFQYLFETSLFFFSRIFFLVLFPLLHPSFSFPFFFLRIYFLILFFSYFSPHSFLLSFYLVLFSVLHLYYLFPRTFLCYFFPRSLFRYFFQVLFPFIFPHFFLFFFPRSFFRYFFLVLFSNIFLSLLFIFFYLARSFSSKPTLFSL